MNEIKADGKTIGLIYFSLSTGGIQRGASFLIPQFVAWGYKVVVLTVVDPTPEEYDVKCDYVRVGLGHHAVAPLEKALKIRAARMEKAVRDHHIDLVIHHSPYSLPLLTQDVDLLHRLGVKVVVHWHSVFSDKYVRGDQQLNAAAFYDVCRRLDGLITLSHTDATAFTLLGCRACCIPYADVDLLPNWTRSAAAPAPEIVWIGRFWDVKKPLDAVKIVERLLDRMPTAHLTLLGRGDPGTLRRVRAYVANHSRLAKAVTFAGFQRDVTPFLKSAGVGLLTSRFEGYCHSLVEMKMAGLPAVVYAMPYLDTAQPDTGVVSVPQDDVAAAADAIAAVLNDADRYARLSREARTAYEKIAAFDSATAYRDFFDRVFNEKPMPPVDMGAERLGIVLRTFVEHAHGGFRDMEARCLPYERRLPQLLLRPYLWLRKYVRIWRDEGWYGFKVRIGLRFGRREEA